VGRTGGSPRHRRRPRGHVQLLGQGAPGLLGGGADPAGSGRRGLSLLDTAIDRFVEAGGRTGVVGYKAARATGLAAAGRVDAAPDAVVAAYRELETYGERFAEPLVLEADASMRHARGDDPAEVAGVFAAAIALAGEQGSHGIARRVTATARRLGL
jgi:hypothetical protein